MQAPADATPQHELPTDRAIGSQTADSGIWKQHPLCQCQNRCRDRHSPVRQRNHVPNSHVSESECIHHLCQCQFHPLHFHSASLRQFKRLVSLWKVLEEMMLVTTVAPGPRSEGCLLAGAGREIHPSFPRMVHSHGSRTHCKRGQS